MSRFFAALLAVLCLVQHALAAVEIKYVVPGFVNNDEAHAALYGYVYLRFQGFTEPKWLPMNATCADVVVTLKGTATEVKECGQEFVAVVPAYPSEGRGDDKGDAVVTVKGQPFATLNKAFGYKVDKKALFAVMPPSLFVGNDPLSTRPIARLLYDEPRAGGAYVIKTVTIVVAGSGARFDATVVSADTEKVDIIVPDCGAACLGVPLSFEVAYEEPAVADGAGAAAGGVFTLDNALTLFPEPVLADPLPSMTLAKDQTHERMLALSVPRPMSAPYVYVVSTSGPADALVTNAMGTQVGGLTIRMNVTLLANAAGDVTVSFAPRKSYSGNPIGTDAGRSLLARFGIGAPVFPRTMPDLAQLPRAALYVGQQFRIDFQSEWASVPSTWKSVPVADTTLPGLELDVTSISSWGVVLTVKKVNATAAVVGTPYDIIVSTIHADPFVTQELWLPLKGILNVVETHTNRVVVEAVSTSLRAMDMEESASSTFTFRILPLASPGDAATPVWIEMPESPATRKQLFQVSVGVFEIGTSVDSCTSDGCGGVHDYILSNELNERVGSFALTGIASPIRTQTSFSSKFKDGKGVVTTTAPASTATTFKKYGLALESEDGLLKGTLRLSQQQYINEGVGFQTVLVFDFTCAKGCKDEYDTVFVVDPRAAVPGGRLYSWAVNISTGGGGGGGGGGDGGGAWKAILSIVLVAAVVAGVVYGVRAYKKKQQQQQQQQQEDSGFAGTKTSYTSL